MRPVWPLLGILILLRGGFGIPLSVKKIIYVDCQIYNHTHIYGGPICGSDGVNYSNSVYLDCQNHQNGRQVATAYSGNCLPLPADCNANLKYEPVCGTDGVTYTNRQSFSCANSNGTANISILKEGACEEKDPCRRYGVDFYGINPVCGSNGFTYENVAQVKCLQRYNNDLKILHDGGCNVEEVRELYGDDEICKFAIMRYEWNPICASDGRTYVNPFVFLCAQQGKQGLEVIFNGECDLDIVDACKLTEEGQTGNAGEVCGNDGKTYSSIHHLLCRSNENKYLFVKHKGECSGPDDNPCGAIPGEKFRTPVCGSDGSSYVSPEALWCARFRSPEVDLRILHDGHC